MIYLFKKSDNSWIFSGSTRPANMEGDDYVEGVLPEGQEWDYRYEYYYDNGIAKRGKLIVIPDMPEDNNYAENRLNEYPSIEDQLDDIYHNGIDSWKAKIKAIKDKYPKE